MVYGGQKILVDDLKKLESLIGATYDDMIVCLDRYLLMFRMNNLQTLPAK